MFELIFYPFIASIAIAAIGGPLGSLIIWQRMAYFGESIAHSALLGVALAILLNVGNNLMIVVICCLMAVLLNQIHQHLQLSLNTLLAIMAHTSLAIGLVIISFIPDFRFNIEHILFGDLLTLNQKDFFIVGTVCLMTAIFLASQWQKLIALAANEELAFVEGLNTRRLQLILMVMMAIVIAIGIKAVGILLIVSLLIIPAATARRWVGSPEAMAISGSVIGMCAICLGLLLSYIADTPSGPSIVAIAGVMYFLSQLLLSVKKQTGK